MSLKIAIVGCGKIADAHVEEIKKIPAAELVAACDAEPLMAEQLAVRYGIPRQFSDLAGMLAEVRPDVLHIATPPQSHLKLALQAMDAGCHVFVEKPLGNDSSEAEQMIAAAGRTGCKLTTGWSMLFDPPALALRDIVREGLIGDPVHVESYYGYDLSGPFGAVVRADKEHWLHRLPGKLFHNTVDHLLNRLVEFFGDERPEVTARAWAWSGVQGDLEDELRVMLRGARMSAYATFSANARPAGQTLTVYGTRRTVKVDYISRTVTFAADPRLPGAIGRLLPAFAAGWGFWREGMRNVRRFARSDYHYFAGLNHIIARFYQSILENGPPPIAYADLLWVSHVIDEVIGQIYTPAVRV